MPNIFRTIVIFISRSIAKIFLFLALSVSTPTVNAMRFLEENKAVVIVMESNSFRRRDRGLVRRLGYHSEIRFSFGELANYGV